MKDLDLLKLASKCLRTLTREQRAAKTRQGNVRLLACCEDILKGSKRPLSRQTSLLHFLNLPLGTCAFPYVLLDAGCAHPVDQPAVEEKVPAH